MKTAILTILLTFSIVYSRPYKPSFDGSNSALSWVCEQFGNCKQGAIDLSEPLNPDENIKKIDWYFIRKCEADLRIFDEETSEKLTYFSNYASQSLDSIKNTSSLTVCLSLCEQYPIGRTQGFSELMQSLRLYLLLSLRAESFDQKYSIGELIRYYLMFNSSDTAFMASMLVFCPKIFDAVLVLESNDMLSDDDREALLELTEFYNDARIRNTAVKLMNIIESSALCLAESAARKNFFRRVVYSTENLENIYHTLYKGAHRTKKEIRDEIKLWAKAESPQSFSNRTIEYFDNIHNILNQDIPIDEAFEKITQVEFERVEDNSLWIFVEPRLSVLSMVPVINGIRESVDAFKVE